MLELSNKMTQSMNEVGMGRLKSPDVPKGCLILLECGKYEAAEYGEVEKQTHTESFFPKKEKYKNTVQQKYERPSKECEVEKYDR